MNEVLIERIRRCPSLPSLPAIAVQVLQLVQSNDVDIPEIARVITRDPALSSKILKTVNSSFYGRPQPVSTVSHALVILGLQSVKTLVLGFSLVSNLSGRKKPGRAGRGFDHMRYWRRSVYAATAAKIVGSRAKVVSHEELFLATLLSDIGQLVLDQVLGEEYGALCDGARGHDEVTERERSRLGLTHAEAGGVLAESWKLPPLLSQPLAGHHSPESVEDPSLRRMAELVRLCGQCADVFVDQQAGDAIAAVRQRARQLLQLDDAQTDDLLAEVGTKTREVANLFEINLGSTKDYEEILKKANETLVELTLRSQMQAQSLAAQNEQLKAAAYTDALTGLGNRQRFDSTLAEHVASAQTAGAPLSLVLLDLDHFKQVNDRYGHPAGDAVLREVARLVKAAARTQDVACRYGGEELALVLPGTTRTTASAIAETLRRAIASRPVPIGPDQMLPVSASLGVATMEPGGPIHTAAQLIKAADVALYSAKKAGRNCVKVLALPPHREPAAPGDFAGGSAAA